MFTYFIHLLSAALVSVPTYQCLHLQVTSDTELFLRWDNIVGTTIFVHSVNERTQVHIMNGVLAVCRVIPCLDCSHSLNLVPLSPRLLPWRYE